MSDITVLKPIKRRYAQIMTFQITIVCFRVRYRYDTYRRKVQVHYREEEGKGKAPLTDAQKARKLIAVGAKALQEIRYYQRGTERLVPKAAMARYINVERMSKAECRKNVAR